MNQLSKKRLSLTVVGILVLVAAPAVADQLADMAAKLANLRGEVETLSAQVSEEMADGRDKLRSLSRQKSDLELEVKKEQTRASKLRQAIVEKKSAVTEAREKDGKAAPLFEQSLESVRSYISESLPFRTSDRLSELEKIESQYKSGLLSAPKALGRLWAFMEDEFRLTRENGMYQQSIVVDGQAQLAEVVRLGMVMLYFKVGESTVGKAVQKNGTWTYEVLSNKEDQKAVLELFQSFKKQIRAGFFEIPSALPALVKGADK